MLMSRGVVLLDSPRLITKLAQLERRTGKLGRDSVDHARGANYDLANAAAGSLVLAAKLRGGFGGGGAGNRDNTRRPAINLGYSKIKRAYRRDAVGVTRPQGQIGRDPARRVAFNKADGSPKDEI
jgi:hypothetical protein